MGLRDWLGRFFNPSPAPVDYAARGDDELSALWIDRRSLTGPALDALTAEIERRGLHKLQNKTLEAPAPIAGSPIQVVERVGVLLRTHGDRGVLVIMPLWDEPLVPEKVVFPEGKVESILVLDGSESGWLSVRALAQKLGVGDDALWSLDPRCSVERLPDAQERSFVRSRKLQIRHDVGWLSLYRDAEASACVVARWRDDSGICAIVGAAIPPWLLKRRAPITHVVGGLRAPVTDEDWADLRSSLDPDVLASLLVVMLFLDAAEVETQPWTRLFPPLGVTLATVGREQGAANAPADESALRRALELQPTHPESILELGAMLADAGRPDEAIALYDVLLADLADLPVLAPVLFNRASCLVRAGRLEDAERDFVRCAELMPEWDAPLVDHCSLLATLGRKDEAHALLRRLEAMDADPEVLERLRRLLV